MQHSMQHAKSPLDNVTPQSDTAAMSDSNDPEAGQDCLWQKTNFENLTGCKPSQANFARFGARGKLIRRSLESEQIRAGRPRQAHL